MKRIILTSYKSEADTHNHFKESININILQLIYLPDHSLCCIQLDATIATNLEQSWIKLSKLNQNSKNMFIL